MVGSVGDAIVTAYDEGLIRIIDARIAKAQQLWSARGTVVQRDTIGPGATVVFDGDAIAMPVKVLGGVICFQNDRVVLLRVADTWVVTGTFSRNGLAGAYARLPGPSPAGTTSSASYSDQPAGVSVRILKRFDDTDLNVGLSMTCYVTGSATTLATAACRIAGTAGTITATTWTAVDLAMNVLRFDVVAAHFPISGYARQTSMPAGDYTITARWRRTSGSGVVTQDTNDFVMIQADEFYRGV